jgi:MFS family permease
VVGWRNALLAGTVMVSFLLSGWILDQLSFQWGYATVFAFGALGAALSTYHIARIQVPPLPHFQMRPLRDKAQPGRVTGGLSDSLATRLSVTARLWLGRRLSLDHLSQRISSRYRWAMAAFFLFHFSQLLPAALFPVFWVREANLSDGEIGWINATFYFAMLVASPFLEPLTRRLGNYRLTVWGAVLLSLYPLLTALSYDLILLLVASVAGGVVWALLSGALVNRLLELAPENDRPTHFAFYNLALNIATLSSTMLGPLLADVTGLREAIFIVFLLRVGSGFALGRWG